MKRRRIQSSGVGITSMLLVVSGATLFAPKNTNAQCPNGNVPMTTTYTAPPVSEGATGGTFTFTLPQYNPSPGGYTLISAALTATATTTGSINYKNNNPGPSDQIFVPAVTRRDQVSVNGNLISLTNSTYSGFSFVRLKPAGATGDNVTLGPSTIYNNTTVLSNTETNAGTLTSDYQGTGTITLDYTTNFFLANNIQAGIVITPTIADNVNFSVTYTYCVPTTLSSNILTFTAEKAGSQTVDLKWETTNEQPGRKYYIEVSTAGQDFAIAGSVPSSASSGYADYSYSYPVAPSATGKIYFRLREVDIDGTATWSDVRTVNLDGNGSNSVFSIYPNPPSDFINLTIPGDVEDWQVDIMAADGSLVQRGYYRNSNAPKINFVRRLSAGTYFVRAVNPQTGKSYSGSFLMRQ